MLCIDGIANIGKGAGFTATIAYIRTESGTPGDSDSDDYKVYLNYTYEGEDYKDVYYRVYSAFMFVGKKINIKIDENDPTKIYYSSEYMMIGYIFVPVSIMMMIMIMIAKRKSRIVEL